MSVGEGLFWSAISLWGIFYEHPPPAGELAEDWARLEAGSFRISSLVGDLRRAGDVATAIDLLERMTRTADACADRLRRLPATDDLCRRARLHLATVRRELDRHRRDALVPRGATCAR